MDSAVHSPWNFLGRGRGGDLYRFGVIAESRVDLAGWVGVLLLPLLVLDLGGIGFLNLNSGPRRLCCHKRTWWYVTWRLRRLHFEYIPLPTACHRKLQPRRE